MTARSESVVISRIRWSGALSAAAALIALIAIGPPGNAAAATGTGTGYNQITGAGSTNSALTVHWAQGLLDNNNKPIADANADRSSATPTNPLSFMYPDFKNLQVTVSQTQDITHQGVTITWKGGQPTIDNSGGPGADFLQLMECYGDASTGPSPQGCEYGSPGLLGPKVPNLSIGTRGGDLCSPGAVPSVTNPPASLNGDGPLLGCDPLEPVQGASPPDTTAGDLQDYNIPFVPVTDPSSPAYGNIATSQYFDEFTSNEVQEAVTSADGTGQLQFETLTGTEAPGLGCGQLESNGQTRNCWLVVVPRGQYEPNGYQINPQGAGSNGLLWSSPLSASNWAMRIQVHLGYAPIGSFCPIGTQEVQTVGTQVVARAVQSWQLALNKASNCTRVYGYSAVPEATSTQQLALSGSPAGMAFTTIPIGSEARRSGGGGIAQLPPILYAPIAVSAVGFGFNINEGTGYINTPVKLSPVLLAKGLTQVYRTDLPDFYPTGVGHPGPAWSVSNPVNISEDPQFQKLNPEVPATSPINSLAPLLTEDQSALNQQIWQWMQADTSAGAWLNHGTTDAANTVTADPDYKKLKLGTPPAIDSFPRAYAGKLDLGKSSAQPPKEELRRSLDLLPYVISYDSAASEVLTANNPTTGTWDDQAIGPDGTMGWWDKNGAEPLGHIFIWGISDTADLAAYGLVDAQMCNDSGSSCVGPSTASLTTALNSAKPDSAGLLQVNPARPGAGGYPLVQVTYAAVDTHRSKAELKDYADLIAYAAGAGQTPGVAPGDLPPGYLPLTAKLKAQAMNVVAKLRADANGPTSHSPSPTSSGTTSATGTTSPAPSSSTATPTVGLSITPPSAELTAAKTQGQTAGAIRWALLVVALAGAVAAAGGTVLRSDGVVRWLRRMRQ